MSGIMMDTIRRISLGAVLHSIVGLAVSLTITVIIATIVRIPIEQSEILRVIPILGTCIGATIGGLIVYYDERKSRRNII